MPPNREAASNRRRRAVTMSVAASLAVIAALPLPGVAQEATARAEDGSIAAPTSGRPRVVVRRRTSREPTLLPARAPKKPDPRPDASGIQLYPPAGTDPLKAGVIVPEQFELPPGYMRHYQTTDDGQTLQAILVFHPDYDVVDEHGNPVDVGEDRIVPPELAPPGLQVEILQVPAATDRKPAAGEKP